VIGKKKKLLPIAIEELLSVSGTAAKEVVDLSRRIEMCLFFISVKNTLQVKLKKIN